MEISYVISQKEYIKIVEYVLRQKARQKKSRLWFFMLTGGQMLVVFALILFYPGSYQQKFAIGVLSVVTALCNVLYRNAYRFKASYLFSGLKSAGQYSDDFWKKHILKLDETGITLSYGNIEQQYELSQVASVQSDDDWIYLMKGDNIGVLEAIPKSALGWQQLKNFEALLDHLIRR